MTKKQYDLEKILSNRTYNMVKRYAMPTFENGLENPNYGLDAMALIGKVINNDERYEGASTNSLVDMFHALADPTFINLADEWGSTYQAENEMVKNIGAYADGKFNSFSLKGQPSNLSYLPFPLRGNRMSADKNFTNYSIPFGWDRIVDEFEEILGIEIIEGDNLQHAQINNFEQLLSPAVRIKGTNKVLLSQTFNGAKLSDAEKFLAVLDVFSHENVKKLLKEDKALANDLKNVDATTARQILYAGQITADLFAALAPNIGSENHKQIENALRLELCGVLANLKDKSAASVKLYAKVAEKLTQTLLDQLHQSASNIVSSRADMGIGYVDNLYPNSKDFIMEQPNLKAVMFGRTINNAFKFENNQVMFVGNSAAFDALQPDAQPAKAPAAAPAKNDIQTAQPADAFFAAAPQTAQEEDIVWIPEDQPDGSLPTEIDWIPEDPEPEDAPQVEINQFDVLKIKALEDHYDLPLPAASAPVAESAQEAILLPPVQDKPQVIELPPVQEPVKNAQPKLRSLADLVAETRVARRDAEMFAKHAAKTTTQTKLFGDDYAPTAAKPLEQNPQVETQQTTLAEYEEKTYLDLRPLIENVPVIERSILNADMKDFDLSKTPIFEAQTTEKTTEENAEEITTTRHKKSIKVARKNTVRDLIGYGKSPLAEVKANLDAKKVADAKALEAKKLAPAPKYKISLPDTFKNALKQNDFSSMQMQHMLGVLYKGLEKKEIFVGPKTPNATKKFAYFAHSEEVAKKYEKKLQNIFWYFEGDNVIAKMRAKKMKFAVDFADYLAEENQVALNAKKLAYVAKHKEYLENEEKNARIARVRAYIEAWQQNNAKKKIATAAATAGALKAQMQSTSEVEKTAEEKYILSLPKEFYRAQVNENARTPMVQELENVLTYAMKRGKVFAQSTLADKTLDMFFTKAENHYYVMRNKIDAICKKYHVATPTEQLAFVADHAKFLAKEKAQKLQAQEKAKAAIEMATANANALKAEIETTEENANEAENTPSKISKRKTSSNQRLKKGKVLHVWKDGHYDYV